MRKNGLKTGLFEIVDVKPHPTIERHSFFSRTNSESINLPLRASHLGAPLSADRGGSVAFLGL